MNRAKSNSLIVRHDRLGPVPVMSIKIPNGNPFSAVFQCIERSDSNVAEVTETHCLIARGVVSGWTHQAKRGHATQRGMRSPDGRTGRAARVHVNVWIKRCIKIKTLQRLGNALDMPTRVCAQ